MKNNKELIELIKTSVEKNMVMKLTNILKNIKKSDNFND
jgi:hypothetical protein